MSSVFTTVTHAGGIATLPLPFTTVTQTGGIVMPPSDPTQPLFTTVTVGAVMTSVGDMPGDSDTSLSSLPQPTAKNKAPQAKTASFAIFFYVIIAVFGLLIMFAIFSFFRYRRKPPEERPALIKKMEARFPGRRFVDSRPPDARRLHEDEMQQWHQGGVSDVSDRSSKRMSQLQWELPPSKPLDMEPDQPRAGPGPSTVAGWSRSSGSDTSVPYIR